MGITQVGMRMALRGSAGRVRVLWESSQGLGRLLLALWSFLRAVLAACSVKVLDCPLLILHAEDDGVLPPKLGHKVGTCHGL